MNAKLRQAIGAAVAQADQIERDRIGERIDDYIAQGSISNAEREIFLDAALRDEARVLAILDSKPTAYQRNRERFRPTWAGERFNNLCSEHRNNAIPILREVENRGLGYWNPRNENTIGAAFPPNYLILKAIVQAHNRFPQLKVTTRIANPNPYSPLSSGVFKYNTTLTNGSAVLTNATSFNQGDSVLTGVTVTVQQLTASMHIRNVDLNDGARMDDLAEAQLINLADKVTQNVVSNITAANFPILTPVIRAQNNFSYGDSQTAWTAIKKANSKQLLIDGNALANLINVPSLFQPTEEVEGASWRNLLGFQRVCLNSQWSTAGANIYGFACDRTAIGTISGMPLPKAGDVGILHCAMGILPDCELSVASFGWFDLPTRTYWASYDLAFGSGVIDDNVGCVIASGTPT
jgi:hypothetical protein